jgi:hypothetical protein
MRRFDIKPRVAAFVIGEGMKHAQHRRGWLRDVGAGGATCGPTGRCARRCAREPTLACIAADARHRPPCHVSGGARPLRRLRRRREGAQQDRRLRADPQESRPPRRYAPATRTTQLCTRLLRVCSTGTRSASHRPGRRLTSRARSIRTGGVRSGRRRAASFHTGGVRSGCLCQPWVGSHPRGGIRSGCCRRRDPGTR